MTLSNDPWIEFRKDNGEFKKWLHIWMYQSVIKGHGLHAPWGALPWVLPSDQPLNGEALEAMFNLGVTHRWPGEWPRFSPIIPVFVTTNLYGVILPTASEGSLSAYLDKIRSQCLSRAEFIERLDRRYVLFPEYKEKLNAHSRSSKDRIPLV